ncbi:MULTISPECIES: hypothetical protein [unclassified Caulobacter]|uniref:hypothetical protein n=1 Tax=unclassified Caulobacter TaxID=2648921 RepID=UPI000781BFFC|nr:MULTISPECIES: hypothetical protein [unclassified Caulobacter]AZS23198.1 hypothetical protein CSW63_22750 [Caulobacter sp. FWC26]
MSTVRPAGWPTVPSKTSSTPAAGQGGASTRAAFFQAALGDAAPTRPAAAPSTVQMQTMAQPQQRQAPPKPFVQPDAQPTRILRPGSLLNIVV